MKYLLFIGCFCWCFLVSSQQKDSLGTRIPKIDSIQHQRQLKFYRNLQSKTANSKFTHMLHGFLFHPVDPANNSRATKTIENQLNRKFKDFQGKRIRSIKITTLDPFGYSEKDSTRIPDRKIDKFGNGLHSKSKEFTIRGLLVVKENEPLDSLMILESERLLRRRNFVRRALIRPQEVPGAPGEVDLQVYVLDSWSIAIGGNLSTSKGELEVRELNFMGLGHQVTAAYKKGFNHDNGVGYTMGYRAQNIYNTYINAEVSRDVEVNQSYRNLFQADRTFYSPYTRWAGKIGYLQRYDWEDLYMSNTDTTLLEPLKRYEFDVWGGYAIPVANKDDKESLPTNLIIGARYAKRNFSEKPDETIDSVSFFTNQNFFLGSVGLRHVNYVRDRYIFRNGDIEDIAVGSSYFINSGYQQNSNSGNYYTGLSVTMSNYFSDFGYIAANAEYGSYYSDGDPQQSLFRLQTTYFTPVFSIGNWYFRQFAKLNSVVGIDRKNIILDRIDLNGDNGIEGFDSRQVFGTRKFVFSFKTQSYVPFNWIGFRMSPFVDFDLGFIGSEPQAFFKNKAFTKFGIGFLVSNDYFVFESIKLSFFYIPKMPGNTGNLYQFQSSDYNRFDLEEYDYQPPHIIEYR